MLTDYPSLVSGLYSHNTTATNVNEVSSINYFLDTVLFPVDDTDQDNSRKQHVLQEFLTTADDTVRKLFNDSRITQIVEKLPDIGVIGSQAVAMGSSFYENIGIFENSITSWLLSPATTSLTPTSSSSAFRTNVVKSEPSESPSNWEQSSFRPNSMRMQNTDNTTQIRPTLLPLTQSVSHEVEVGLTHATS